MIEKINSISANLLNSNKHLTKSVVNNNASNANNKTIQLLGSKYANSLKAINISFGNSLTSLEASIIGQTEIRIPNIL